MSEWVKVKTSQDTWLCLNLSNVVTIEATPNGVTLRTTTMSPNDPSISVPIPFEQIVKLLNIG